MKHYVVDPHCMHNAPKNAARKSATFFPATESNLRICWRVKFVTVVHIHAEKLHYARVSYSELLPTSLFTIGCLGFVHIGHMSDYKYVGFQ